MHNIHVFFMPHHQLKGANSEFGARVLCYVTDPYQEVVIMTNETDKQLFNTKQTHQQLQQYKYMHGAHKETKAHTNVTCI